MSSSTRQPPKRWKQAKRLRFWVKNSLLSPRNVIFEESDDEGKTTTTADESSRVIVEDAQQDTGSSDDGDDDMHEVASCRTVDEAMSALYSLPSERQQQRPALTTWEDAPRLESDYDWILDGNAEHFQEAEKSQQLQQALARQDMDFESMLQSLTTVDFDILGRQEHSFANFDEAPPPKEQTQISEETATGEDEEGCWGDFVSATETNDQQDKPESQTERTDEAETDLHEKAESDAVDEESCGDFASSDAASSETDTHQETTVPNAPLEQAEDNVATNDEADVREKTESDEVDKGSLFGDFASADATFSETGRHQETTAPNAPLEQAEDNVATKGEADIREKTEPDETDEGSFGDFASADATFSETDRHQETTVPNAPLEQAEDNVATKGEADIREKTESDEIDEGSLFGDFASADATFSETDRHQETTVPNSPLEQAEDNGATRDTCKTDLHEKTKSDVITESDVVDDASFGEFASASTAASETDTRQENAVSHSPLEQAKDNAATKEKTDVREKSEPDVVDDESFGDFASADTISSDTDTQQENAASHAPSEQAEGNVEIKESPVKDAKMRSKDGDAVRAPVSDDNVRPIFPVNGANEISIQDSDNTKSGSRDDGDTPDGNTPHTPTSRPGLLSSPSTGDQSSVEDKPSVYKLFPLADVSSPEGRFTRRRQLETRQYADTKTSQKHENDWWRKSQQEMAEEGLPAEYYTDSFDGTLELLQAVPWEHVPFWKSGPLWLPPTEPQDPNDILLVDEHVTQKLSELDASKAHVTAKLLRQIQQREDMLTAGNQLLHDMDHNLTLAQIYVHRSKESLDRARGQEEDSSGLVGGGTILQDSDRRDHLRQLQRILKKYAQILETEESLKLRIASFGVGPMMQDSSLACHEYRQMIAIARQLRRDVTHDECVSNLLCLIELRERACTVLESFRDRIHTVLTMLVGRCCHDDNSFPSIEYESLLRAMLELHVHQAREQGAEYPSRDKQGSETEDFSLPDAAQSWSQCILTSFSYEVDKCLARALLDPTNLGEEAAESAYDKELIYLSLELNNGSGDTAKLRTLTHNLVTIRFDFEGNKNHLPLVYHKLCLLLTDVLHAHYLLMQWHKAPFDERNKDMEYLHRKEKIDYPKENNPVEVDSENVAASPSPIVNGLHGEDEKKADVVMNAAEDGSSSCMDPISSAQLHEIEGIEQLQYIVRELRDARIPLWRRCESVLATCLDQYLHFAAKKKLFQQTEDGTNDEETWIEDMEGLHDVLQLTHQFISLGHEFLDPDQVAAAEVTSLLYGRRGSELHEKLCEVFRRHLRSVHVEAMNSMGAMLSKESWKLIPINTGCQAMTNGQGVKSKEANATRSTSLQMQCVAKESLTGVLTKYSPAPNSSHRCWENQIHSNRELRSEHLPNYIIGGNPFLATPATFDCGGRQISHKSHPFVRSSSSDVTRRSSTDQRSPEQREPENLSHADEGIDLYSLISSLRGIDDNGFPPIATHSGLNGLSKWSWRLLTIMRKLPIILGDVATVFSNLFDLYFTTAFRLCAGSGKHEDIILGKEPPAPHSPPIREDGCLNSPGSSGHRRRPSGSGIFGRQISGSMRARKSTIRPTPTVPPSIEADICAPLPSEMSMATLLLDFVRRGQKSLEGIVNLERIEQWMKDPTSGATSTKVHEDGLMQSTASVLERREGAAWSCLFVAALIDVVRSYAENTISAAYLNGILGKNIIVSPVEGQENPTHPQGLAPLASYSRSVVRVAPALATLASRIACLRGILARNIVQEIVNVGPGWDEPKLNEHSNAYVDELCDRLAILLRFLLSSPRRLPPRVLGKAWEQVVGGAYLALLEGFSIIAFCSTEGRALMSMDLASFCSGVSNESIRERLDVYDMEEVISPSVSPPSGMQYVDRYIKVSYFPPDDVMQWITQNHKHYQLNHSLALVTCRIGDGSSEGVKGMQRRVKTLYEEHRK